MKSRTDVEAILARITVPEPRGLSLQNKGDGWLLSCVYMEPDIHTGKVELQRSRKWYISPHATETEIVETAFECIRRSLEHQLREHFLYNGRRVFSRHFDVNGRVTLCDGDWFEKREPVDAR